MALLNVRKKGGAAPGTAVINADSPDTTNFNDSANPMDGEEARALLAKLLNWWFWERNQQAANRLEMAMDEDFYDGLQWSQEEAAVLRDRGQMPLVFNEIAPMIDWIIGTERRSRVDWSVMPRTEDDVELADIKEKVLKWISDINRVQFNRSRAFAQAVKAGVSYLDDGCRDDPTQEAIYSRMESWRAVLPDSRSREPDYSDARYIFRWRWVDEDVALAMFPERADAIRMATDNMGRVNVYGMLDEETDEGYLPSNLMRNTGTLEQNAGPLVASGTGQMFDQQRRRVKIIECQFRVPEKVKIVDDGPFRGVIHTPGADPTLDSAVASGTVSLVDKVAMRVHVAMFTEGAMLGFGPSIYRHNRFSITPLWAYRRGVDGMPYGVIRRIRDIQADLNKRASKASHMLNTVQIIMDEGAVDDVAIARDEADRPDGTMVVKNGKKFELHRDSEMSAGQVQLMTLNAQAIQRQSGVSDENLGRQTNAVSGEAIRARQLQGSVVTTELFDNLRLATQVQGEKQLSLCEQFLTGEKVIRLTGASPATGKKFEWVKINQPEQQPDGSWRWVNDITATQADFVVADQDYAGTMRQVMFEQMMGIAQKLPPEVGLKLMPVAFEFSDMPNKDEIASAIRQAVGQPDPNAEMSPEQQQQMVEAQQMQREQAALAMQEQQAKVRELNAKAAKLEAEAGAAGSTQDAGQQQGLQQQLIDVQRQAADQLDAMQQQLVDVQRKAQDEIAKIRSDADTAVEVARINANSRLQVAEITAASNAQLDAMRQKIEELQQLFGQKASPAGDKPASTTKE